MEEKEFKYSEGKDGFIKEDQESEIKDSISELKMIAQRVGSDFKMNIEIGPMGGGSFFNHETCTIVFDPLHIEKDPDLAKFVAGHEGSHRAITSSPEKFLLKEKARQDYSQLGFGVLQNSIEDPAVNNWMRRKFPGLGQCIDKTYDEMLGEDGAVLGTPETKAIAAQLGYTPKFVKYTSEVIKHWHQQRFSKELDPDVEKALERTMPDVEKSISTIPDDKVISERDIVSASRERYRINSEYIWPEYKNLIEMDIHNGEQRQMIDDFKEKEERRKEKQEEMKKAENSGDEEKQEKLKEELEQLEKELAPFDKLPEGVKKDIQEKTKKEKQNQQEDKKNKTNPEKVEPDSETQNGKEKGDEKEKLQNQQKKDMKPEEDESSKEEEKGENSNSQEASPQKDASSEDNPSESKGESGEPESGKDNEQGDKSDKESSEDNPSDSKGKPSESESSKNGKQNSESDRKSSEDSPSKNENESSESNSKNNSSKEENKGESNESESDAPNEDKENESNNSHGSESKEFSEETKKELEKLWKKISKEKQEEFNEKAKKILEDLEDAINEEIEGKLNEDKIESHQTRRKREQEEQELERIKKEEKEMKELMRDILEQKRLESMTPYERSRAEVIPLIDDLYYRLRQILRPDEYGGEDSGYASGSILDLSRAMQAEHDEMQKYKLWIKEGIPDKRDYRFWHLVDLSGSMAGEKIRETFKGFIVAGEAIDRLEDLNSFDMTIHQGITGFNDSLFPFKDPSQRFTQDIENSLSRMPSLANNGTDTYKATIAALEKIKEDLGETGNFILTFSDGEPNNNIRDDLIEILKSGKEERARSKIKVGLIWLGETDDVEEINELVEYYGYDFGLAMSALKKDSQGKESNFSELLSDLLEDIIKNSDKYE